ncbi:TPA: hypothetical protein JG946_003774 [Enterobacter hormaechei subsp. steigerwaltii]|nr:hypothetical protein [Enterobacter hormaechei subsp. steigerwaltii]
MKTLPDMTVPAMGVLPITLSGDFIIQAKTGAVNVSNTGAALGAGFALAITQYNTFSVGDEGLQVTNSTAFPVTIAVIQL